MSSLNENVDNGADAETLSQVPEVVELVRIHGREQPKMRELAAEFAYWLAGQVTWNQYL